MSSDAVGELQALVRKLRSLTEPELRELLRCFMENELGQPALITHGAFEHGADIIAPIQPDRDPLGMGQTLLIQVKAGDVGLVEWRANLAGQLAELYSRRLTGPGINDKAPRRMLLVLSGVLRGGAVQAINEWSDRLPVPVEVFDVYGLARLLRVYGYSELDIDKCLSVPRPTIPAAVRVQ